MAKEKRISKNKANSFCPPAKGYFREKSKSQNRNPISPTTGIIQVTTNYVVHPWF